MAWHNGKKCPEEMGSFFTYQFLHGIFPKMNTQKQFPKMNRLCGKINNNNNNNNNNSLLPQPHHIGNRYRQRYIIIGSDLDCRSSRVLGGSHHNEIM
jgi:hypothetical protein